MQQDTNTLNLIKWQFDHSSISTPGARLFAITLCLLFSETQEEMVYTDKEIAKIASISPRSVPNYSRELAQSGDWAVTPLQNVGTTYMPLFINHPNFNQ